MNTQIKIGDTIYRAYFTDSDGNKGSAIIVSESKSNASAFAESMSDDYCYLTAVKIDSDYTLFEETRNNEPIFYTNNL